tara:strand:+ start:2152 stop:2613 length:462 start_codon:yes stop_codon:yes gene_type:complete
MKKIITFVCISLFCILSLSSQSKRGIREKIKTLKIAYLTEKLSLTPNEAEKFWPIYNIHDKKEHSLRSKLRSEIKKATKENEDIKSITENEAKRLISLKQTTDKKIYEARKDFINKMKKIISYKKIIQLELAEKEFSRKLMDRYRRKKGSSKN